MAIGNGFFEKVFGQLDIVKSTDGAQVHISYRRLGKRFDAAQDALDAQVWSDMQKYMPFLSGNLIQNTNMLNMATRGEVYTYDPNLSYGHYQYEGWQYVDPKYGVAGWYSAETDKWWSRKGITKIKSDKPLFYTNPMAEAHWDEKAYQTHVKQWVNVAKRAIRGQ